MHEDMRPLLNAYLDGELHGLRLLQVQTHLAGCAACRDELKALHRVSTLLRAAPAPAFRPVEPFVAHLTLKLPRRALRDRPPKPGSLLWWLAPAVLLGAWFFVRTTFAIVDAVTAAGAAGLLGPAHDWLLGGGRQSLWLAALNWLAGDGAGSALGLLNTVGGFGVNLFKGFLWQAAIVALYWGWLAAWWLRRRPRPMKLAARPAGS